VRRRLLIVLVLLAVCGGEGPARNADPGRRVSVRVLRVVDGDTAHMDLDGEDVTIRFIGIDTPETVKPGAPVGCFGRQASDYVHRRLDGASIALEFDVERIDPYGRTLAYVWIGDELFNRTLVAEGYATVTTYPPNVKYVDEFIAAQRRAREVGLGVWGACPQG
jgi:micrococcal nuclease